MALTRLNRNLITSVSYTEYGLFSEEDKKAAKYVIGATYSLRGVECEGFEMPSKEYILKGVVNSFHGVDINSVVVKQVGGERGPIFTLSRHDCSELGIDFEDGLQLFPKGMPWKMVEDELPYEADDLSTSPRCKVDNMVRHVLLKVHGFSDYKYGYILTPSGRLVKERDLMNSFVVRNAHALIYPFPYMHTDEGSKLQSTVAMPKCVDFSRYGNYISDDNAIYIAVNLACGTKHTLDGLVGVDPKSLSGLGANDLFAVFYDEEGAPTEEEFPAFMRKKKEAMVNNDDLDKLVDNIFNKLTSSIWPSPFERVVRMPR